MMSWRDNLPTVRGKLLLNEPLGPYTWFRVGGAADAEDLADFLKALPEAVPVTIIGVGSNLIVRDGGALTMNAGCYGSETKDVLVSAWGLTRQGERIELALADFGYTYRHSNAPAGVIWMEATYRGAPDAPDAVAARINEITSRRETTQPIREKTGGSTFKNPEGHSSWKLVDEAGWRGKLHAETGGGAKFSELHANFMINPGEATAADIEGLGEAVRADVLKKTGVQLDWEIKRIGRK